MPPTWRSVGFGIAATALVAACSGLDASALDEQRGDHPAIGDVGPQSHHTESRVEAAATVSVGAGRPSAPRLGTGDRLSLKIYERSDLSGDFLIRGDGKIAVPLLGTFDADGRTLDEVENDISQALERATDRKVNVMLDVAEWRPVFVVGGVEKPGAYPFRLNMSALQALATAGGPYRVATSNKLEAAREVLLQRQTGDRLKSLLVKRERFQAELAGQTDLAMPAGIEAIASEREISAAMSAERRTMQGRAQAYREQSESISARIELARREVVILKEQFEKIQDQQKSSTSQLEETKKLIERGLTSKTRIYEAQRLLTTSEVEQRSVAANLVRAELTLAAAEKERSALDLERRMKLEDELKTTDEEIRGLEMSLVTSEQILGSKLGERSDIAEPRVTYEIIRHKRSGPVSLSASEEHELQPGDILRVHVQR